MRPLLVLSARSTALAVGLVLVVGLFGGVVRLLPWLVARDVPFVLAVPFARVLLGAALDVAVLVGLPVGMAVAAALFVERGEARALLALGASPRRLVGALVLPFALVLAGYVGVSRSTAAEPLGTLGANLLAAGRLACARESPASSRVDVPLVSLSWLCLASGPRLAGRVPGFSEAWFSAREVQPSADFGSVELSDVHLAAHLGARVATLRAGRAELMGLPRWPGPHGGRSRGLVVAVAALLVALSSAWLVIRRGVSSPLVSAGAAALTALAMLRLLAVLDARTAPLSAYVGVPVLGVGILAFVAGTSALWARIARARSG